MLSMFVRFTSVWVFQVAVHGVSAGERVPTPLADPHGRFDLHRVPKSSPTTRRLLHVSLPIVYPSKLLVALGTWELFDPLLIHNKALEHRRSTVEAFPVL